MKNLILLFSLVAVLNSYSAQAADHFLRGGDAEDMAQILRASGFPQISDVTVEFVSAQNPICTGANFVDQCKATPADFRPAANPRPIVAASAGKFWGLLKKAGFENQISEVQDGFSEKTFFISASRIDCQLNSADQAQSECTLN